MLTISVLLFDTEQTEVAVGNELPGMLINHRVNILVIS